MIRSKLTGGRTTIPKEVRAALDLRTGDELAYVLEDGRVLLDKARADVHQPFAVFEEWTSEADRRAYAGL